MRLLKNKLDELNSKKIIAIFALFVVLVIMLFTLNFEDKTKEKKVELIKDKTEVNQVNKDNHSDLPINEEYSFINQKDRTTNDNQKKEVSDLETKVEELPEIVNKDTSSTEIKNKDKSTSTQTTKTTTEASTSSKPISTTPKSDSKPTTTPDAVTQPKEGTTPSEEVKKEPKEEKQPIQQPKPQPTVKPSSLNKDSILNSLSSNGYYRHTSTLAALNIYNVGRNGGVTYDIAVDLTNDSRMFISIRTWNDPVIPESAIIPEKVKYALNLIIPSGTSHIYSVVKGVAETGTHKDLNKTYTYNGLKTKVSFSSNIPEVKVYFSK